MVNQGPFVLFLTTYIYLSITLFIHKSILLLIIFKVNYRYQFTISKYFSLHIIVSIINNFLCLFSNKHIWSLLSSMFSDYKSPTSLITAYSVELNWNWEDWMPSGSRKKSDTLSILPHRHVLPLQIVFPYISCFTCPPQTWIAQVLPYRSLYVTFTPKSLSLPPVIFFNLPFLKMPIIYSKQFSES